MVAVVALDVELSRFDAAEDARDLVRRAIFQGSLPDPIVGEGKGVMSPIAANCGEVTIDVAGETDLMLEWSMFRRLNARRGRLVFEIVLWR